MCRVCLLLAAICAVPSFSALAEGIQIQGKLVHLRAVSEREWDTFPVATSGANVAGEFEVHFHASKNNLPWTLIIRQVDVKQRWEVRLNDKRLGRLVQHEEDLFATFDVPAGTVVDGENRLQVKQTGKQVADDIFIGGIVLHPEPLSQFYDATVLVDIVGADNKSMPGRTTVVNLEGVLVPVLVDAKHLAAREGVVYTATGAASFRVPSGRYRIYGGRGFEYAVDQQVFSVGKGETIKRTLKLSHAVDTTGWVACDTHVHTVTHSGHGDCTIEERMVTLAGEGIELPIATDHNKQIDYRPISAGMNTERFFTPVVGNEVTTKIGHFNVFPARANGKRPDHTAVGWKELFAGIYQTPDVKVAILNHGRDIHGGYRPFSPRHHVSLSGENLDGWELKANAMEILNSGATQTDTTELFRDWCGLVNRGLSIVPVGCSDSHDVSRYIVGQARTYLRCDDQDPAAIDVDAALESLLAGRLIVSYGLMADVVVVGKSDRKAGPGELLSPRGDGDLSVKATIRGPLWCDANLVELYVNGVLREREQIPIDRARVDEGVVCEIDFFIARDSLLHDAWITVVALGGGIQSPHWHTAKPYQPDSPKFVPCTFSCCGPIRIDLDGDGEFTSANEYAKQIISEAGDDDGALINALVKHDDAVAIQVASVLSQSGTDLWRRRFSDLIASLPADTRDAINHYRRARRESENARLEARE